MTEPKVAVIMGSVSDWETMQHCVDLLETLSISYHAEVVSAHRTPNKLFNFASNAKNEGYSVIIAAAGGAAHLPGMVAAMTSLPVIGVPIKSRTLQGVDSLLSIVQMPAGVPVSTMSIGRSGAINAALTAASILALVSDNIETNLVEYRKQQTDKVLSDVLPSR